MQKTNRRSFIDLAEAVRTLNVEAPTKERIVSAVSAALVEQEDFSLPHFSAHAMSEVDGEEGKWAYNKAQGTGPGSGAVEADEDEDNSDDEDED